MKQVICNGRPFAIVGGRRVWLAKPPADVQQDIEYDQRRLAVWGKLWSKE